MAAAEKNVAAEEYAAYLIGKRLLTKPQDTEAFRLGLIDADGLIVREPENREEEAALTLLDKLALHLRKQLGTRVNRLRDFMSVYMGDEDKFGDKFVLKGGMEKRSQVQSLGNKLTKSMMKA
jgi:hypothetical protein